MSKHAGRYNDQMVHLRHAGRRHDLTDGFLATVAARYLAIRRGYARQLAREYVVEPRTITSWVVLARERGLLTAVPAGSVGGQLTAKGKRALQAERRREREEHLSPYMLGCAACRADRYRPRHKRSA